jgi:hypothetical protein
MEQEKNEVEKRLNDNKRLVKDSATDFQQVYQRT